MFPLFIDLRERLAVVVGGGPVGRRKTTALLAAEAHVRLVCLEPRPTDETADHLEWLKEPFCPEHLTGAVLVCAAATAEVNRQVVAAAREQGLWVNCADPPELGDCFLPSVVRRGDFTLAIGTAGAAPALSRQVRLRLEKQFDAAFGEWVALLAELRPLIQSAIADPRQRRRLFKDLSRWPWLRLLRHRGIDHVREEMLARVRKRL
jgi:precorrin-2 dehydrogenase